MHKVYLYLLLIQSSLLSPMIPWAISHPHVFIAQETQIVFDDKGLAGFKIKWTFDEMFSVMISDDFDADRNGHLDKKEVAVIKEKAFGYISQYNYYMHVRINDTPFTVKFIKDFNAILSNGNLTYEFFIPCHVTATKTKKYVTLSPYDQEYYSAIYFPDKRHLTFKDASQFEARATAKRDMSTLFFYETVNPLAVFLEFGLKQ